jgi:hypothetical protein
VGDRVFDDPVVDVEVRLLPWELFPLELLDPHPVARAATTKRAATGRAAEPRTETRFELIIAVLPCNLQSTSVADRDVSDDTAAVPSPSFRPPVYRLPPTVPRPMLQHTG